VYDRKARSLLELKIYKKAVEAFNAALSAVQVSNMKENRKNAFIGGKCNSHN
jgi:hypothetical protein